MNKAHKEIILILLAIPFLVFFTRIAYIQAGQFYPETYEDCLLAHFRDANSDEAAKAVAYACRKKYGD